MPESSNVGSALTQKAAIRTAALELFSAKGFRTTVREIAAAVGASTDLVIHHYGSKDGLREACDEWLLECVATKEEILGGAVMPGTRDFVSEHPETRLAMAYMTAALREGGPLADTLFDRMCTVTARILARAEASGTVRPSGDPAARAAVLVAWSCGGVLLHDQLARHLDGTHLADADTAHHYSLAAVELLASMFSPDFLEKVDRTT